MATKENKNPQAPRGFFFKSGHADTPGDSRRIVAGKIAADKSISTSKRAEFTTGIVPGAPSIVEQARALRNDPQLIYQFVHDNIEWEPGWGLQKGALGALLDGMGNSFEQSALMIELLREAGFTASYVMGTIELSEDEFNDWFQTSSIWASYNYCLNENIPCETPTWNGSGYDMIMSHVWVECEIDATTYVFDPSRKEYTLIESVSDLGTILDYSSTTFISNAEDGATVDSEYVQNINTSNIRDDLTSFTGNLVSWISTNDADATVDNILGGKKIVSAEIPLLQTSLPYEASGDSPTTWTGNVPPEYKTTLRIRFPGSMTDWCIDETFYTDELAGTRLTLFFNGSLEPVLSLNGSVIATGDAQGVGTWNSVLLNVTHNAYSVDWFDQEWWQQFIWAGRYYLIGNAWGNLGNGQLNFHIDQLSANEVAGGADTDEPILGEKLAITFFSWAAQNSRICDLINRMTKCHTMYNHQVGIISFDEGDLLGTDLGGVSGSSTNLDNDVTKTPINDTTLAMHGVALEAGVLMQMTGSGTGAATTTVINKANEDGDKIYKGTSANWNSGTDVSNILEGNGYNSGDLDNIYNWFVQWGYDILISENPGQVIDTWEGWGYWAYPVAGAYGIINGGLLGGKKQGEPKKPKKDPKKGDEEGDPIDILTGSFVYRTQDLSIGSQSFPYQLSFNRTYQSGNRYSASTLGYGWSHNQNGKASVISNGFAAMGEQSAVHAAATIAELFVCIDLISDTDRPVDKLVIITLADRWWLDQVTYNTVSIAIGEGSTVFQKQPDGTYIAADGSAGSLIESVGEYVFTDIQGVENNFDTDGRITSIVFPYGMTITYTYNLDGLLESVSNGLGRELNFTYTTGKLTSVEDETERGISFDYDVDGNLTEFTDCNSKTTVYEYGDIGLMTKVFLPAYPVNAFIENIYDSLSRVKEQKDGSANLWTYYIAGYRAEEVDPANNSKVFFLNKNGRVIREINQLGKETQNEYDGKGRLVKVTQPEGNSEAYEYDSKNNLLKITKVAKPGSTLDNIVNEFTYDPDWNKIATSKDGLENITTYEYDEETGVMLSITFPEVDAGVPVITFTYNERGQVLTKTDSTGMVTKFTYDDTNEEFLSINLDDGMGKLNLLTQFEYDDVGNLSSVTDPKGNTETRNYDLNRRLVQIIKPSPFAYEQVTEYDDNGNPQLFKRSTGDIGSPWQAYSSTFDSANAFTQFSDPLSHDYNFGYNNLRLMDSIEDPVERTNSFTYDEAGRVKELIDPAENTAETVTYSDNGLRLTAKDANDNVTTFEYDGFDRLTKITFPDDSYEEYAWNENDNLTSFTNRIGDSTEFNYDALSNITSRAPENLATVSYEYDLAGRSTLISTPTEMGNPASGDFVYTYDAVGRLLTEKYPDNKTISYDYDENSNQTKVTYPDAYYVEREFDELNRLVSIKLNGSMSAAVEFEYDDLSRKRKITYDSGVETNITYNADDTIETTEHIFDGSSVQLGYGYNDAKDEIEKDIDDSSYMWHPTSGGTITYATANELNEYPTVGGISFSYNDNGCLTGDGTWTFAYDELNQMVSANKTGVSIAYVYDPVRRQIQKAVTTSGTIKTRYVYSGWKRIADYNGSNDTLQSRYVFGNDIDKPIAKISSGGTVTYFHTDRIGSIIATSDNSGAVDQVNKFGAFGETSLSLTTSFGFTGQRFDTETGLYYFKNRYFSPAIGRFLQPDPAFYVDGLNLYTYVNNDPLNKTDVSGLSIGGGTEGSNGMLHGIVEMFNPQVHNSWINPPEGIDNIPVPSYGANGFLMCVVSFQYRCPTEDPCPTGVGGQGPSPHENPCPRSFECKSHRPNPDNKPCPSGQLGCHHQGGGGGNNVPPGGVSLACPTVGCKTNNCPPQDGPTKVNCRTGPDCKIKVQTDKCGK
ncbi:MAG: RHS repeat-associated core domain-containing protein [Candidatus Melainabacteria bacterium]|nr:RHS repeat-associated core domain-containing protein [Candidatus Melainabacteria bacterium]